MKYFDLSENIQTHFFVSRILDILLNRKLHNLFRRYHLRLEYLLGQIGDTFNHICLGISHLVVVIYLHFLRPLYLYSVEYRKAKGYFQKK